MRITSTFSQLSGNILYLSSTEIFTESEQVPIMLKCTSKLLFSVLIINIIVGILMVPWFYYY